MALIAPIDYERYAVFISPSLVPTHVPAEAPPPSRAPETVDPTYVDVGLRKDKLFHEGAELTTPPLSTPSRPASAGQAIAPSSGVSTLLNVPWVSPEFLGTGEIAPNAKKATALYETRHELIGPTLNLVG